MLVEASEKLFYGKFGYKVLIRQAGTKEEYEEVCDRIKAYLMVNIIDHNQRGVSAKGDKQQGFSLCCNSEDTIKWLRVEFPDYLVKLAKPINDTHKEELYSSDRIRVRPLFFRKFKYSITFSRFKARLFHINLGDQSILNGLVAFEHGEGELLAMLQQYKRDQWHAVNKYDLTIYCNSPSLVMQLRLKYESIITDFISVKTLSELE